MFTQTIGARRAQVQSKHYGVQITNRRRINVGVQDALMGAGALLTSDMKCSMPTVSGVKRALWNCLGVYLSDPESMTPNPTLSLSDCTVKLYTGLAISAEGSSQRLMYHCNPSIYGSPWYDDVLILSYETDANGDDVEVLHAGRLRALVSVQFEDVHIVLALVHGFQGVEKVKQKSGRGPKYHSFDVMDCLHDENVRFPYMQFAYQLNGDPVYWLVDSETVSGGAWVQENFDESGKFFFVGKY